MHRLLQIHRAPEFGPHWERKIRTCFHRLDVNHSGTISEEDFFQIADRFNEVGHLTGDAAQEMRDYYKNEIWIKYFKLPDASESTAESFIEGLKKQGKKNILATTNDIHNRYFTDIDSNHDDLIDLDEFTKYFYILGISAEDAKVSFEALDINHDGHISRGEFIMAGNDFFGGEGEQKSSDLFFGPLVD
jgi:Ca2+-binding EF-hand superfamily protein